MPGEQQPQAQQLSAHDQAMIAKMDANTASSQAVVDASKAAQQPPVQQAAQVAQRPEHVPEKFWNAEKGELNSEALLKSYAELEKAKPATPAAEPKPGEQTPAPDAAAAEALKAAKLDMGTLSQEFATTGAISEASYKALEGAGIDKATVDSYIAGQVALAQAHDAQGFALAGGQEQYGKMTTWAATNMSAADQAAFNAAVGGSPAQMKQAITALKAQYEAANGRDPKLVAGQQGGTLESETPFESRAQVTAAMRDPRYRTDSAYRGMVERRIGLMDNF